MRARLGCVAGALLTVGCGALPDFPAQPGQERALAIVWGAHFAADAAPPPIDWREDVWDAGSPAAVIIGGQCYAGLFSDGIAHVAWRGSFHGSAFAHELMHALQGDHGVADPQHLRLADWQKVAAANDALDGEGL